MGMTADEALAAEVNKLKTKLDGIPLPVDLQEKIDEMVTRLERAAKFGSYSEDYEKVSHYFDWIAKIPWEKRSQDRLDLDSARQILDDHHYGLEPVKLRILEFLSVLKLRRERQDNKIRQAPILCLVGLAGTGKTSFAFALAEAMDRQFARIPFGGMGSARDIRGQSRMHLEAEPGYVIKALAKAGTMNPIILLDEMDRVTAEARGDIMGVLLELLDQSQNKTFVDHYIDFPVNLNEVLFIATCNNTDNISTAVLNRLEVIQMPTYSDEEKIIISKRYILPGALEAAGLPADTIVIDDNVWPLIVRPLGFDSGVRILKRTIDALTRRIAYKVASGETKNIHITEHNLREYIEQQYF